MGKIDWPEKMKLVHEPTGTSACVCKSCCETRIHNEAIAACQDAERKARVSVEAIEILIKLRRMEWYHNPERNIDEDTYIAKAIHAEIYGEESDA